jgi:hypothetical protein
MMYCPEIPRRLGERSEPEIAAAPNPPRDCRGAHPSRAGLSVADSTLAYDRLRNLAAHARADFRECWIVDCAGETLEVCGQPLGGPYADRRIIGAEGYVAQAQGEIAVRDVLH